MFKLTAEQARKLKAWTDQHEERYAGAIGGRYTFSFTPTSLGCVCKVEDHITGDAVDLTDYESW